MCVAMMIAVMPVISPVPVDAFEGPAAAPGVTAVVRAAGVGYPPPRAAGARARLMAERAAQVAAVRSLARKLGYGRRATVRGFRYVSTRVQADGSVEVVVETARRRR